MNQSESINELAATQKKGDRQQEAEIIKKILNKKFKHNQNTKKTVSDKFFEKIAYGMSDCWYWIGCKDSSGYGRVLGTKENFAHRLSWRLFHGEIPEEKKVLHKCDVRCCVNPEHLFIGTQKENMIDASLKGKLLNRTILFGEKNPMRKLSGEDVMKMRQIYSKGNTSYKRISKEFNISTMTAYRAINNQSWSHI